MTIYRTSGKNIEIYEEYELNTKSYVENVGGKSTFTAKETVYGDKPKSAPPLEINNIYVKVRLKEPYNGEFGFDWVDVNPDTKDIEKIQDVDFSNVEYFYKEGTVNDLGNIIEKTNDNATETKNTIQEHYKFNSFCKHVDLPYVLIKPPTTPEKKDGQEIVLSAEIIICDGEFKDDEIKITGDDFFDFDFEGGTKEDKTAKIKVSKAREIDFKVTCLKELSAEKKYEFFHSNATKPELAIGGFIMMENKVLKLKFRVIALISNENDTNAKAKALFKKFKDANIKDYLNKNSLNQAGYEVEIDNFDQMDNDNVDEYYYAFDKEDWKTKGLFEENHVKNKMKTKISISYTGDGKPIKTETIIDEQEIVDVITHEGKEVDYKTTILYNEKLKNTSKTYNGGLVILSDYECKEDSVGAFSRSFPLNHNSIFVYSTNNNGSTFAHEIGHMLGLTHTFIRESNKEEFFDKKGYYTKLKDNLKITKESSSDSFRYMEITSKRTTLLSSLQKYNTKCNNYIRTKEASIISAKASSGTFTYNNKSVTKTQFIAFIQQDIDEKKNNINNNRKAIQEVTLLKKDFEIFKTPYYFYILKNDAIQMNEEFIKNFERTWKQIISNYLYFKEDSTKNIMDYTPPTYNDRGERQEQCIKFLSHQILIMRNDYENNL